MDFEKLISCQTDAIVIEEDRLMDFYDFCFLSCLPSNSISQHIHSRATTTLTTTAEVEMLYQKTWKAQKCFHNIKVQIDAEISWLNWLEK